MRRFNGSSTVTRPFVGRPCEIWVGATERTVERERKRIAREGGWGARLLARQDSEGTWAGGLSSDGGLYSPKWTSTTYTMLLLRDLGLPTNNGQARKACALLLDGGLQRDGGINYGWRAGRAATPAGAAACTRRGAERRQHGTTRSPRQASRP